jgi:outer membrane protein assembly factor BamB
MVYFQSPNEKDVQAVREAAEEAGLLGKRVFADAGAWDAIQLSDDLADRIWVGDAAVASGAVKREELLRVLHPEGKAVMGEEEIVKPFPSGIDSWSHVNHGPDNQLFSNDTVARHPYFTQFVAEPVFGACPQLTVAAGGRVFRAFGHISNKADTANLINTFLAINGYNGAVLWKRPLKEGFMMHRNTLIATPDILYLADDESCKLLDARTGVVRDEIKVPDGTGDGKVWKWMALDGGVLYALVGGEEPKPPIYRVRERTRGYGSYPFGATTFNPMAEQIAKTKDPKTGYDFGRTFLAVELKTKQVRWTHSEEDYVDGRAVCMKDGRLYFFCPGKRLACLDLSTQKILWKNENVDFLELVGEDICMVKGTDIMGFPYMSYLQCNEKVVVFAGPSRKNLVAVSAENGNMLWHMEDGYRFLIMRPDAIYAMGVRLGERRGARAPFKTSYKIAYDDGKLLGELPGCSRCPKVTASADGFFYRAGGTARYDFATGVVEKLNPTRPACSDGVVISDGLLYWGPWSCSCGLQLPGHMAVRPAGDFDFKALSGGLESGVGGGPAVDETDTTPRDWPNYRRDPAWSSSSDVSVAESVRVAWTHKAKSGGWLSAPVAAYGLVFVGGQDGVVRALDGKTGEQRWKAYTGGAVNFPPAVWKGRIFAGSNDGRIHAYEARTGRLLWRFLAAPKDRRIPVYGQLMSRWPVAGGVLVDDGVLHAVAGMANYDGTHICALDPATGKIKSERVDQRPSLLGGLQMEEKGDKRKMVFAETGMTMFYTRRFWPPVPSVTFPDGMVILNAPGKSGFSYYAGGTAGTKPVGDPAWKTEEVIVPSENREYPSYEGFVKTSNALLVLGAKPEKNADGNRKDCVAALSLKDGTLLWSQELPGPAVRWGLAVDGEGRIFASLEDGSVLCLDKAGTS